MDSVELSKAALRTAIEIAGSQTALAAQLTTILGSEVTQQNVSYWLATPGTRIPPKYCAGIEQITGTPRAKLWPELFGEEAA